MASTYSPDLRIELIGNGQQTGIWGNTTNINLGTLLEQAIAGAVSVTTANAKQALVAYNGVSDEARNAAILLNTSTGANYEVYVPPVQKLYVIRNASSLYNATIYVSTVLGNTTAAGTGVTIPPASSVLLRCDATNVYEQLNQIVGDFDIGGTLTNGGNQVSVGSLFLGGSAFLGASETATISVASPAVVTVAVAPIDGTAVRFSTTELLPAPLDTTTIYYTVNRNAAGTTFNVALTSGGTPINTTAFGTGTHTVTSVSTVATPPAATNNTVLANTQYVTTAVQNALNTIGVIQTKTAVKAATTAAITLSGAQTIDGVSVVAEDRVLVKNQYSTSEAVTISIATPAVITTLGAAPANGTQVTFTTTGSLPTGITVGTVYYVTSSSGSTYQLLTYGATTPVATSGTQSGTQTAGYLPSAANGIYVVKSGASPAWVRSDDANTAAEIAGATVPVLYGTANGGKNFITQFKASNTLDTTVMTWNEIADLNSVQTLQNKSINATQLVNGTITAPKLNGGQIGTAPIYAPRAFVNFSANPADITTTTNGFNCTGTVIVITEVGHSFKVGQCLFLTFSTTMATGFYGITAVTTNTFTVIRQSGSSNISGTVAYSKNLIYNAGNVAFVSCRPDYPTVTVVNFLTPLPSSYYAWSGSASCVSANAVLYVGGKYSAESPDAAFPPQTPSYVIAQAVYGYNAYPATAWNVNFMSVMVLG